MVAKALRSDRIFLISLIEAQTQSETRIIRAVRWDQPGVDPEHSSLKGRLLLQA